MGPNSMTGVLIRREDTGTDTHRRRPCGNGGRDWNYAATNQEFQEPPEAGRGKEGSSPELSEGDALPTPWFQTSGFQTVKEYISVV